MAQNLIYKLTKNKFAEMPLGSLLANLTTMVSASFKLLQINVDRYRMVPIVSTAIPNNQDLSAVYQAACDIFPTFPLMVATQLKSQSNYAQIGHNLQIAAIASTAAHYENNTRKPHIVHFQRSIDLSVDIVNSSSNSSSTKDFSHFPKLVRGDLILIAKGAKWPASQHFHEIIEHLYCMDGLLLIFIRYYFDLIAHAETDEIAEYIDGIFLNFFIGLHFQELEYWKQYPDGFRTQLETLVQKDSSKKRHPVLRHANFEQVKGFNPLIHDGGARKITTMTKSILDEQLQSFYSFSLKKLALFLRIVTNTKSQAYPRYLLVQIAKTNPKQLYLLKEFLNSDTKESVDSPELLNVVSYAIEQLTRSQPSTPQVKKAPQIEKVSLTSAVVHHDEETLRLKKAAKHLQERAKIASYSSEQLADHFQNYLDQLYARSQIKGALTQDKIKEYLTRFTKDAAKMARKTLVTPEEKNVFEESVHDMLKEFGKKLTQSEINEYQTEVKDVMSDFETSDVEKRVWKIECLGGVMNEAAGMSQRKEDAEERAQTYQEALAVKIQIGDDPKHVISVEDFLNQPIALYEKIKFLYNCTPDPLTVKRYRALEDVQNQHTQGTTNPVAIYKGNTLLVRALTRLLFPKNTFKLLLQREIIPILPDKTQPSITVRDFFSFPFAEKKKGPEEDSWFAQHLYYLGLARDQGVLKEEDYQGLVENIDKFPVLEYRKYYNIVRKNRLEETVFMAVYSLWKNNGLEAMRIKKEEDSEESD
ncbi:MAG: hypothetical protein HQM13_00095 [SAR324 cluster bacterium]|nr:hypothetical protein [SAR324 cluster bacterium]